MHSLFFGQCFVLSRAQKIGLPNDTLHKRSIPSKSNGKQLIEFIFIVYLFLCILLLSFREYIFNVIHPWRQRVFLCVACEFQALFESFLFYPWRLLLSKHSFFIRFTRCFVVPSTSMLRGLLFFSARRCFDHIC